MKTSTISLVCFALVLILAVCYNARADIILVPATSFGTNAVHETFGEPIDYSNAVNSPIENKTGSMVVPGAGYVFTETGVIFLSPNPNTWGDWLPNVSMLNNKQYFNFGAYGELLPWTNSIPGDAGGRFLLTVGASANHFAPFMLAFPGDGASQVGGNFIMSGQTPGTDQIIVTAYGLTGDLLGTASIDACDITNWNNNFLGIKTSDGSAIKSIGVDYSTNNNAGNPGIADLVFIPVNVVDVPEPSSLSSLIMAIISGLLLFIFRHTFDSILSLVKATVAKQTLR